MRPHSVALIALPLFLLALVVLPCVSSLCAEDIIVAAKVVARISYPGEFPTVAMRVADIDKRIANAISVEDVGSPKMRVTVSGSKAAIYVGKTLVMNVYAQDARENGVGLKELANAWSKRFATLLPLAEPCIHMDSASAGSELAREQARAAASANVRVPPQRWAITSVVLDDLTYARRLSDAAYEAELPGLIARIRSEVRCFYANERAGHPGPVPPHKPGSCPQAGGCPACKAAREAALAGLQPPGAADACSDAPTQPPLGERRVREGLKLARIVDEPRFLRDRIMIAWTLVKNLEKNP